jgi:hypothetical protein
VGGDVVANCKSELKKPLRFESDVEMNHEDHQYGEIGQQRAGAGTGIGNLMWLLAEMLRVPLTIFVSTIEVFTTSMRGIQRTTDQVIDTTVGGMIQGPGQNLSRVTPPGDLYETRKHDTLTMGVELKDQQQKEQSEMEDRDIDLRGDDLKLVEYDIWFTKADLHASLDNDRDVIAYSTTTGDYKGIRISKFLRELSDRAAEAQRPDGKEPVERPNKWKENNYPPADFRVDENGNPAENGDYYSGIPLDDIDEFVKVDVRLISRRPKDEKDESDRLKDINKTLRGTLNVRTVP